jgi:hypothetical protein
LVGLVASTVGDRAKIAKGICVFQHNLDYKTQHARTDRYNIVPRGKGEL